MATLLVAEHINTVLKDATNKALTAARALGGEVHVLVAGKGCRPAAEAAAKLDGVAKVLLVDDALYEHMVAEPVAALIVSLAGGYDAILAPATTTGKNIMPRVAALLDVMQISDIIKVVAPDTFDRLIYAGSAVQTVRSRDAKKVITVRTSTFQATAEGGATASIEPVAPAADPDLSSFVGEELSKSERPELTSARIIISGGRALQSRENFAKYIEPHRGRAWRRGRRLARGGRRRLCAQRLAGRSNRQGGRARALRSGRHFWRDPASCRHEGLQSHRRYQQGRGSAHFPSGRLRPCCRSLQGAARTYGRARQTRKMIWPE